MFAEFIVLTTITITVSAFLFYIVEAPVRRTVKAKLTSRATGIRNRRENDVDQVRAKPPKGSQLYGFLSGFFDLVDHGCASDCEADRQKRREE